ncbi:hypothetical protein [Paenisporosarcina indica]|uniref:hypothetical protein n=1 Tax=Paenisporosarcina indica TaxID=650093 RepID=UPI00094FC072|nr:hypothetical protein [Paenisporosarcina indica]
MWEAIIAAIMGIGFLILGIRHNKRIHKDEGAGSGVVSESLVISVIIESVFWIFDQLPYWVAKSLYFLIAIALLVWSYKLYMG